jgi:ribosomal protein L7/L12
VSEIDLGARGRLDYIEQQLEALFPDRYVTFAAASGTTMPPGVVELARAGKVIAAIQEYRNATGAGLKEAKVAVESLLR